MSIYLRAIFNRFVFCVAALALLCIQAHAPAHAKTLRWSGAGELVSCDPAIGTDTAALVFMAHIYERLVTRGREFTLQPSLALSWAPMSPTTMRFKLRPGIKFHDGTPFTADDIPFSIARARTDLADQIKHGRHQISHANR